MKEMINAEQEIILLENEAQRKLFIGMEKLAKPVISTLGPNGKTVILGLTLDSQEPIITKDGVSVANYIRLKDPVENIGCNLLKEAAQSLLKTVGDGTTTTTLLAYNLIKQYMPQRLDLTKSEIQRIADEILEAVNTVQPLELNPENLRRLILNVSNSDEKLTDFILHLVQEHPGYLLKLEDGVEEDDSFVVQNGYYLRTRLMSSSFFTSTRSVEFDTAEVLLINDKIERIADVKDIISAHFSYSKAPLVVIAHEFHMDVIKNFATNFSKGYQIYPVEIEGTSQTRLGYLEDIALLLETKVYSIKEVKDSESKDPIITGPARDIQHVNTSFSFSPIYDQEPERISQHREKLRELIQLNRIENDRKYLQERLNKLSGGLINIYVGGSTPSARKERYDRFDDVIRALEVAQTSGVVLGGGFTALSLIKDTNHAITNALFRISYDTLKGDKDETVYKNEVYNLVFDSYKGFVEGYKVSVELFLLFTNIGCVTIND
jgi:chaperonin GroEL